MPGQYIQGNDGTLFVDQPGLANPQQNVFFYNHLLHQNILLHLLHEDGLLYTWDPARADDYSTPPVYLWIQEEMGLWPWGHQLPEGAVYPPLCASHPPTPPTSDTSLEFSSDDEGMFAPHPPLLDPLTETQESDSDSDESDVNWQEIPIVAPGHMVDEDASDIERDVDAPEVFQQ